MSEPKKPDANIVESNIEDIKILVKIGENIEALKEAFKDCADVVYKDFSIGDKLDQRLTVVYIDGLIDKDLISENVTKTLMLEARQTDLKRIK